MKKFTGLVAAATLALTLAACQTPGERAVGGALIGGAGGATIGAIAGGPEGALVGGLLGAGAGAIIGAGTAEQPRGCPYGSYRARDGYVYCR